MRRLYAGGLTASATLQVDQALISRITVSKTGKERPAGCCVDSLSLHKFFRSEVSNLVICCTLFLPEDIGKLT
jgi:hypothetical protein